MEESEKQIGDYVKIVKISESHKSYGGKKILNKKGKIIRAWIGHVFKWYIELDSGQYIGASNKHLELIKNKDNKIEEVKPKLKKTNKDLLGL